MNQAQEDFMRSFFARQRELHRKSLEAVANMAQTNIEMIRASGVHAMEAALFAEYLKKHKSSDGTSDA